MNILLIGATGGIGSALTKSLSKNHNLFIGSRNNENLSILKNSISTVNKLDSHIVDVCEFESINTFLDEGYNSLGSINCIINCSGSLLLKPAHLTSEEEIESIFRTNVFSCFHLLKGGFKFLKDNGGSFIFFSSAASKIGLKNHEAIASAKGAVSSLVLSAASTYANYNIRINAIAPGLVDTNMTKRITSNKPSLEFSKKLHVLNRIGNGDNFIPIVNSLIDERSDWITGQTLFVDGGLSNLK